MLALYVAWHLKKAWAPVCFADEAPPEHPDPIAPARRSNAALAKGHTKKGTDGEVVHSFKTLLAELATLTPATRSCSPVGRASKSSPCPPPPAPCLRPDRRAHAIGAGARVVRSPRPWQTKTPAQQGLCRPTPRNFRLARATEISTRVSGRMVQRLVEQAHAMLPSGRWREPTTVQRVGSRFVPEGPTNITLSRVPRRKLAETVAQELLEAIRTMQPGARVPSERELTKTLGVGRSTVREALNGLALLGVIDIRHGQGVFVADSSEGDEPGPDILRKALRRAVTKEFIEARLVVEVQVARLAAQRRTDDDLRRLADALDEQRRRLHGDLQRLLSLAATFNVRLAEAAHNEILVAIVGRFVKLMIERGSQIYALQTFREWDLQEHQALFDAIEAQNADLAASHMRTHILDLAEWYRQTGAG